MADLVNTKIAAKEVGLSITFLYKNHYRLPGAYRAGRALRWDIQELKKWMREQACKANGTVD